MKIEKMINQTNTQSFHLPLPELLKNLVEIGDGEQLFDLHNDYDCVKIKYHAQKKECRLSFKMVENERNVAYLYVDVILMDATIADYALTLEGESLADFKKIDLLYRGRFH